MEINADSLRDHYEKMGDGELCALWLSGDLTEMAFGVVGEILEKRRLSTTNIPPGLRQAESYCGSRLVEKGREMSLIMSNARLHEVLCDWRRRRPGKVGELLFASSVYAAIATVGAKYLGSIDNSFGRLVLVVFVATSTIASLRRAFSAIEEIFGNERVRHMKSVLKAGGYPPAEVVAEAAKAAESARKTEAARNVEAAKRRSFHPSFKPFTKSGVNTNISAPKDTSSDVMSPEFLHTYEWRKLRMEALKLHGAKCQCCGATKATGAVIHVDHIKPRKYFPELALEIDNLQVLCHECNHGKGNWDMTAWKNEK